MNDRKPGRWLFIAAAGVPGLALAAFCAVGIHEWWLISSGQIAVIPTPVPGMKSAPEVPAARLVPLILVSGALAAAFAYALWRGSRRALVGAWVAVALVIAFAVLRRTLLA